MVLICQRKWIFSRVNPKQWRKGTCECRSGGGKLLRWSQRDTFSVYPHRLVCSVSSVGAVYWVIVRALEEEWPGTGSLWWHLLRFKLPSFGLKGRHLAGIFPRCKWSYEKLPV